MAEQNILNGGIQVLDQVINDITEHKDTVETLDNLKENIEELNKELDLTKKSIQDEMDKRVQDSLEVVAQGYDKSISSDREKLKDVQNKREKAKDAGVKERIENETAYLKKENEAYKAQIKDMFAHENIPLFCNSRLYFALFRTKKAIDVLIYLVVMGIFYAAIPFAITLIPEFPLWGMILYYVILAIIHSFVNKVIVEKTLVNKIDIVDQGKELRDKISVNTGKIKKISKNIKSDKNEEMYGLEEFDSRIKEIKGDIKKIESEKERALEDFDNTTKNDIINEITERESGHLNKIQEELEKKSEEQIRLESLVKEQRIYISSNYEAYLGKECATLENLSEVKKIMESSTDVTNIAQAMAIFREKKAE